MRSCATSSPSACSACPATSASTRTWRSTRSRPRDAGESSAGTAEDAMVTRPHPVIASNAKQSRSHKERLDCFVASASRNDGERSAETSLRHCERSAAIQKATKQELDSFVASACENSQSSKSRRPLLRKCGDALLDLAAVQAVAVALFDGVPVE